MAEARGGIELVTDDPESMESRVVALVETLGVVGLTDVPRRLWHARKRAEEGLYRREQMPVIDESDFQSFKEYVAGDGVTLKFGAMRAKEMRPLQRQIYVDKSVRALAEHGVSSSMKYIASTHIIVSSDSHIIDGHHRWLSAMLTEPDAHVPFIMASGSADAMLKEFIAFSDAEGKSRNQ